MSTKQYSTLDSFNNVQRPAQAAASAGGPQRIMLLPNYGGVAYDTNANGTQTPSSGGCAPSTNDYSSSFCAGYSTLGGYSCGF